MMTASACPELPQCNAFSGCQVLATKWILEDSNYNCSSENKMMLLHLHRCIFQIIATTIFALLVHSQWEKMGNCSKLLQMSHLMQAEKVLFFIEIVLQYQQPEAANLARFSEKKLV